MMGVCVQEQLTHLCYINNVNNKTYVEVMYVLLNSNEYMKPSPSKAADDSAINSCKNNWINIWLLMGLKVRGISIDSDDQMLYGTQGLRFVSCWS